MKVTNLKDYRVRRHLRLRRKVTGTAERPRMSVFLSNKHAYVQFIDDEAGKTLASVSTLSGELKGAAVNAETAKRLGALAAEAAKAEAAKAEAEAAKKEADEAAAAQKKAAAYEVGSEEVLITADTIVVLDDQILGKPADAEEAKQMLRSLSGKTHHVITGVCLKSHDQQHHFSVISEVTFKTLAEEEISYYVENYKPFDKAGAYGIQEWIGYIGVTGLSGSYFNVMGLPVQRIYEELKKFNVKY